MSNNNQEPFYLHPPSLQRTPLEAPHAPQDGLYINPMSNNHRHRLVQASLYYLTPWRFRAEITIRVRSNRSKTESDRGG